MKLITEFLTEVDKITKSKMNIKNHGDWFTFNHNDMRFIVGVDKNNKKDFHVKVMTPRFEDEPVIWTKFFKTKDEQELLSFVNKLIN